MDLLKIVQRKSAIRSGHSLVSFAGILSRPVAFDLLNLDSKVKTSEEFVVLNSNVLHVAVRLSRCDMLSFIGILLAKSVAIVEK